MPGGNRRLPGEGSGRVEGEGLRPLGSEVLEEGFQVPFLRSPPLSPEPIILHAYNPQSIKGKALAEEVHSLIAKGVVEPAPPSPGFYSRLFVVQKASGAWRPVIDLSFLNRFVQKTKFKMETVQSVLASIRQTTGCFQ